MNFTDIKYFDLVNGEGVGVSLYVSGCEFNCKGCFNKNAHGFSNGHPFLDDTLESLLLAGSDLRIDHLSILGGEPLHPRNIETVTLIAASWAEVFPHKPIWLWTGFLFEEVDRSILQYVDVLIDGRYEEDNPTTLPFRGSDNQRMFRKQKNNLLHKGNFSFIMV